MSNFWDPVDVACQAPLFMGFSRWEYWSHHFMANIWGKKWKQWQILFSWPPHITADGDWSHEIKTLTPWKESCDKPRQHIKKQKHHFANKGPYSQTYGLFSSHIYMWELDHKEGWGLKNWLFQTVVLEKALGSPLNSKEIKPVNPKGINPECSLKGLVLKLKLQYFGHLMRRTDSLEKTLMLGKIEGRRRRGRQRMRWLDSITDSMDNEFE